MTREEAIEILKRKTTIPNDGESFDTINEAFDLAIKALEQTDVLDKIVAEIQRLRGCSCNNSDGIIDDVEDIIDKYRKEI